jgi:hypothetical protein
MAGAQADTVHVYDTWVRGKNGLLHFDVMTTDEATALEAGETLFGRLRSARRDGHVERVPILSQRTAGDVFCRTAKAIQGTGGIRPPAPRVANDTRRLFKN